MLTKIDRNFQITLPKQIREPMNVLIGDYVEMVLEKDGVMIRPVKMIQKDDAYFYTKEWQEGEDEADRDIAEGNLSRPLNNAAELIAHLDRLKK